MLLNEKVTKTNIAELIPIISSLKSKLSNLFSVSTHLENYPQYPQLKKVEITDKKLLDNFNNKFPTYSDFLFENLINWGVGSKIESEFGFLNNNLIVKFRNNEADRKIVSFLGKTQLNKTAIEILKHEKILNYVPEEVAKKLNKDLFEIQEDRDNSDYVIKVSQIIDINNEPIIKRKKIAEVLKKYPNLNLLDLDLANKHTQQEILGLFDKWKEKKENSHSDSAKCEYDSIKRLFNYSKAQEYIAFGVYDNSNLIGFNIGIKVHGKTMLGTFSKAVNEYRNLFVYMVYIFSVKSMALDCTTINMDVDLGKEGLREAKLSWGANLNKKYTVVARNPKN